MRQRETFADSTKRALAIVNPAAHNVPGHKRLREADRWLREQGWSVEWRETSRAGEAMTLAAEAADRRTPLLLVCGGDGTLNETANGLADSDTAMATIPAGTVNIWAKETGIPRKPIDAVRVALEGERRIVDLGKAGERYFMLMAGYGLDAAIGRRMSQAVKRRVGAAAYALASLRESLSHRSSRIKLVLDGDEGEADLLMLVAGNTRNYAGLVEITPDARMDDGMLDVCVFEGNGMMDIVLHAARTLLRRHRRSKKVRYRKVRRLELGWERPLPVQLDGDAIEESPQVITIAPSALCVVVPPDPKTLLFSR
jgi:YegS/Rv2252/BmrU family lipid kinase